MTVETSGNRFEKSFFPLGLPMSGQDKSEKESFNLIDAASDLFGGLVAGVTVASASHYISGLLAAPVGVGVAHTQRYAAKFFANRFLADREKARVGFVYGLAAQEIKSRPSCGEDRQAEGTRFHEDLCRAILLKSAKGPQT